MSPQCYQCGNLTAEKYYSVAETSQATSKADVSRHFCSFQCYVQRKYELFICKRSGIDLRSGYVARKGRISNIVPKSLTWLRFYKKYESSARLVIFFEQIQHNPRAFVNAMKFFGEDACEDIGTGKSKLAIWNRKIPNIQSIPLTYTQYEMKRRAEIALARVARDEAKRTRPQLDQNGDGIIIGETSTREEDGMVVPIAFINAMEQEAEGDDQENEDPNLSATRYFQTEVGASEDWNDVS